jgi:RimJ/RimL family protein N-acetyltransferase
MTCIASVRAAVEDDAEALLALRQAVFEETEYMLWEPAEFKDSAQDERKRIARLNAGNNSRCLVAAADSGLVGFLNAMGGPVNRLRHSTTLALAVRRSHWGLGVGSALLSEALSWSRSAGLVRVELTVHTTNMRAVALYRRHGFEVEGTRRKSLLVGGRYVDEYLMSVTNAA